MSHNNDMIKLVKLLESKQEFAGEKVGQKPGDQVRGTDEATVGGKDHPFKGRLVGEETALEDVLNKKYQDFKDVQAKEKKEKEELDEFVNLAVKETFSQIDEEEDSAVAAAITRRIAYGRPDLLQKYGPVLVMQAIDDVADFVGDVDEIGSSDVSGWVKQVERNLEEQGVTEAKPVTIGSNLPKSDTETFGIEPGRPYRVNDPIGWKKGDRPRAIQQLIPTQDKKDHIRSRLGKHRAPVLPEEGGDGTQTILSLLKDFVKTREEPEDRKIVAGIYKAFQQGMEPGFTALFNAWEFDIDADFYYFARNKGVDLHAVADRAGFDTDSIREGMLNEGFLNKIGSIALGLVLAAAPMKSFAQQYFVYQDAKTKGLHVAVEQNLIPKDALMSFKVDTTDKTVNIIKGNKEIPVQIQPEVVKQTIQQNKTSNISSTSTPNKSIQQQESSVIFNGYSVDELKDAITDRMLKKNKDWQFEDNGRQLVATMYNPGKLGLAMITFLAMHSPKNAEEALQVRFHFSAVGDKVRVTPNVNLVIRNAFGKMETKPINGANKQFLDGLVKIGSSNESISRLDHFKSDLNELGATPPAPPQGTATAPGAVAGKAAPTSGNVTPDEQKALDKINKTPAMKQQLDKLMTQATPGAASAPMKLDPEEQNALDRIKANAGLGTQYAKLIKQANPTASTPAGNV